MKFTSLIFTLIAFALASKAVPVSHETEDCDRVKGGESFHIFPCVDIITSNVYSPAADVTADEEKLGCF